MYHVDVFSDSVLPHLTNRFFNDAFQAKQIYISSRFPLSSEVQGCVRLCSSLLLCSLVKMIIKLYQRGAASMNYAPL